MGHSYLTVGSMSANSPCHADVYHNNGHRTSGEAVIADGNTKSGTYAAQLHRAPHNNPPERPLGMEPGSAAVAGAAGGVAPSVVPLEGGGRSQREAGKLSSVRPPSLGGRPKARQKGADVRTRTRNTDTVAHIERGRERHREASCRQKDRGNAATSRTLHCTALVRVRVMLRLEVPRLPSPVLSLQQPRGLLQLGQGGLAVTARGGRLEGAQFESRRGHNS